jgi:4-amino-4-deoxy-L-arabinose transferase-like glycosyltransferase
LVGLCLFVLHIYIAFLQTDYSFIDDYVYVEAAIRLVLGRTCDTVAENACNYEHPPLAKLILALGFEIFGRTQTVGSLVGVGINQLGGRFFQMSMDFLAAPILYLVVNRISSNWRMAFAAAILVAVDPLYYTLSLTAEPDNAMLFFALAALLPLAYSSGTGSWRGYAATGALLGLSLLSKETAIFIVLAILSYILFVERGTWRKKSWGVLIVLAVAAAVFMVGLQAFDSLFTSFPSAIAHLSLILNFQLGFGAQQVPLLAASSCGRYPGLCPTDRSLLPHLLFSGIPLTPQLVSNCNACWTSTNPLDWLTYFPPVVIPTGLVLAPNYLLVWLCFVWVPLAARSFRRLRLTGEGRALLLALFLFGWNLASDFWAYIGLGRPVFEWYFLPAVPALAIGAAYHLTRVGTPKWVTLAMMASLIFLALLLSPLVFHALYPQSQSCIGC